MWTTSIFYPLLKANSTANGGTRRSCTTAKHSTVSSPMVVHSGQSSTTSTSQPCITSMHYTASSPTIMHSGQSSTASSPQSCASWSAATYTGLHGYVAAGRNPRPPPHGHVHHGQRPRTLDSIAMQQRVGLHGLQSTAMCTTASDLFSTTMCTSAMGEHPRPM